MQQALAGCETGYILHGEPIRLVECERIPGGTLVLTGTPEGVMFTLATIWAPWAYLRPGLVVQAFGSHLGALRNEIVSPR